MRVAANVPSWQSLSGRLQSLAQMLCTVGKLQRRVLPLLALHPGMTAVLHVCCHAHALPAPELSKATFVQLWTFTELSGLPIRSVCQLL